jgi:hypothetical protein
MPALGRPITLPVIKMEDNQPLVDVTTDIKGRITKCKYVLMLVDYPKEQIVSGFITVENVPSNDNIADMLTKTVTISEYTKKNCIYWNDY